MSKFLVFLRAKNIEVQNLLWFGVFPSFRARQPSMEYSITHNGSQVAFSNFLMITHFFLKYFFHLYLIGAVLKVCILAL